MVGAIATVTVALLVFERFHFMLDLKRLDIWLKAANEDLVRLFTRDRTGLGVAYEGDQLRVVHVAAGSPASKPRWKAGETIARIDGHPVGDDYVASGLSRWRYGPAKSSCNSNCATQDATHQINRLL